MTRLYAVLIPSLLLGGAIDLICLSYFGASDVYTAHHGMKLMLEAPASHLTVGTLLGNYLFLQLILVPVFGSNGPLWSLSYEFWYYLAFPLLFFALWKRSSIARKALSFVGLFAVLLFVRSKIAAMGLIWLMGVAIHWLPAAPGLNPARRRAGLAAAFALTVGCLAWCKQAHSPFSDYVLGVAIMLLVYSILHWVTVSPTGWVRTMIQYSAKSSYTLYLVHLPPLILLAACIGQPRWEPNMKTLAYSALVFIAVLGYAGIVYLLFERHTDALRRWLHRNLIRKPPMNNSTFEIIRAA